MAYALWQLPYFGWIQYPFLLLGTWFHEMGHGLTAVLIGGDFQYLEIFESGGGVAYFSLEDSYLPYKTGLALTAAGGLLGPAISGAVLIASAKKQRSAAIMLRILIGMMILSVFIWIRSFWGLVVMTAFIVFLLVIVWLKNRKLEVITTLFLGIQCVLSTYLQLDYLFTKEFERDRDLQISDTEMIAQNTFGTYWFWAILIIIITVFLFYKSYRYYIKK
ncbi:M50 family metallopeptidase [Aquimarina hainanensis]|uniref:M50 family metallopeptidase n=1 Tax=Aquimarina hainanensis TaxID=1578017 RepID=A0ABW5N2B3_9FLAO